MVDLLEGEGGDDEGARESLLELMANFARADCLACIRPRSFLYGKGYVNTQKLVQE